MAKAKITLKLSFAEGWSVVDALYIAASANRVLTRTGAATILEALADQLMQQLGAPEAIANKPPLPLDGTDHPPFSVY